MHAQQRLITSKDVILINEMDTIGDMTPSYNYAKVICESICGDLYFPSTLEENYEAYSILGSQDRNCVQIWLRLVYNETEGIWKDPENKGTDCHISVSSIMG